MFRPPLVSSQGVGGGGGGISPQLGHSSSSSSSRSAGDVLNTLLDDVLPKAISVATFIALGYYGYQLGSYLLRAEREAREVMAKLEERTRRSLKGVSLTQREVQLAECVVNPDDISETFDMIGGLDDIKKEIHELVVQPLLHPELFSKLRSCSDDLVSFPRGMLLYGLPGTGKTMLAKAIAKSSGAVFLNLQVSTLLNKWFGETQKLVAAAFSLAQKLAPTIIFIDEVDSLLGERGRNEEIHVVSMKTEFMTLMDGILSDSDRPVMVLAATNRPGALDPAVQRRLPLTFEIGMPQEEQRLQILRVILRQAQVGPDVDLGDLARRTEGYSGSDLKALCKSAMKPAASDFRSEWLAANGADKPAELRPLCRSDFEYALDRVGPTGQSARDFSRKGGSFSDDEVGMSRIIHALFENMVRSGAV